MELNIQSGPSGRKTATCLFAKPIAGATPMVLTGRLSVSTETRYAAGFYRTVWTPRSLQRPPIRQSHRTDDLMIDPVPELAGQTDGLARRQVKALLTGYQVSSDAYVGSGVPVAHVYLQQAIMAFDRVYLDGVELNGRHHTLLQGASQWSLPRKSCDETATDVARGRLSM